MAGLLTELDDLVFDGRAVARAHSFYITAVERGLVEVAADHVVNRFVGVSDEALDLWAINLVGSEREWNGALISRLALEFRKVDRAAVQPGRRAGLKSTGLESDVHECRRRVLVKPVRRCAPPERSSCRRESSHSRRSRS